MTSVRCKRVNHLNIVLENFDESVEHFRSLFGGDFLLDLPNREWHACLVEVGRVIFEIFTPHEFLLNARYGPHYVGIEYQVESLAEARAAVAERGLRISRDIDVAIHTNPADSFGMSWEFYEGSFHDNDWPLLGGGKMRSEAHWRDVHPLALTGLKGYGVAVADLDAALSFFQSFVGAQPLYEEQRPDAAARAIGLQLADAVVELLTPTGEGPLQRHLYKYGDGIRSTLTGTRDLAAVRDYFAQRQVELVDGDAPGRLAVPPEANRGIIFEFSE